MKEALDKAKEELKRVDHLIYVSLKYTRTCDVFKSIIERMINAIDFMIEAMLKKAKDEKKVDSIPQQPIAKCLLCADKTSHPELKEMCEFYLLLKKIDKTEFCRSKEFRRHVTMTVVLDGKNVEVNIDNITEYYKKIRSYYEKIRKIVYGEE